MGTMVKIYFVDIESTQNRGVGSRPSPGSGLFFDSYGWNSIPMLFPLAQIIVWKARAAAKLFVQRSWFWRSTFKTSDKLLAVVAKVTSESLAAILERAPPTFDHPRPIVRERGECLTQDIITFFWGISITDHNLDPANTLAHARRTRQEGGSTMLLQYYPPP
jgi:hypothetical protein